MEAYEVLMYTYMGKYKIVEIVIKEDTKLCVNLTYLDGRKEEYLIKKFIYKESAIYKANDLMDKLICFAKGTKLLKLY